MSQKVSDYENKNGQEKRLRVLQPMVMAAVLAVGIFIGHSMCEGDTFQIVTTNSESPNKLVKIIKQIENHYVDTVQQQELIEEAIAAVLKKLDPHSYYISASKYQSVHERMQGNFEGIGVEFMIQDDTLLVVSPLDGGPSKVAGILPGDKIIVVDGDTLSGTGINNERVTTELKGTSGSQVNLGIKRRGLDSLIYFDIRRACIPIHSVVASFMVSERVGYIKVTQFAANTYEEFMKGALELASDGAESFILDFRGNPGGYLDQATGIIEEFLDDNQLMVFTEGRKQPKEMTFTSKRGRFYDMKVVILQNQGSASASEVVAGALQDWDRSLTVGRRSFGKGLVQNEFALGDQSVIRLTVARYYTPTGRSIQKPYGQGIDYEDDYHHRFETGELMSGDSIHYTDSLKFVTPGGRVVYGGGGISPNVFVPLDTSGASMYLSELSYTGMFREFGFDFSNRHRVELSEFQSMDDFDAGWNADDQFLEEFYNYASDRNIPKDAFGMKVSGDIIVNRLKAYIAKNIFEDQSFYFFDLKDDKEFLKALDVAEHYEKYFSESLTRSKLLKEN